MANERIKNTLLINRVRQWELANLLGVCEMTVIRRLRTELPEEEQNRIVRLIEEYAEGRKDK